MTVDRETCGTGASTYGISAQCVTFPAVVDEVNLPTSKASVRRKSAAVANYRSSVLAFVSRLIV